MNNREAQNELCRSTKTPEEVYRLVLLYEQGDKYSKTYVATSRITGTQESAGRAIQIKSKPVGKKQGAFKNGLSRGRGMYHGRGLTRGGGGGGEYDAKQSILQLRSTKLYTGTCGQVSSQGCHLLFSSQNRTF